MSPVITPLLFGLGAAHAMEYASTYTVDGLIQAADDVVVGRVEAMVASIRPTGLIETEVRLAIEDTHRGAGRREVSFWIPGGQVGETVLTIPGAPQISMADRVLVFLDESKPVGLGQGVWTSVDGVFVADSSHQVDGTRITAPAVMGDVDAVHDCLDASQQQASEEGWSVRGRLDQGNQSGTSRGVALSLLEGLEYRITVCGDGLATVAQAQVFSPTNAQIGELEVRRTGDAVTLKPEETGLYLVTIGAEETVDGSWRTRFGVGLAYR